jgi:hypothetical protein
MALEFEFCHFDFVSYLYDALSKLMFTGELEGVWNERRKSESS